MAAVLVTLQQAKDHLYITTPALDPGDADLQVKLDAAESIVLDYIGATLYWRTIAAAWNASTAPPLVKAAILLQLGELWRFRGDDREGEGAPQTDGDLSPSVTNILRRYRDPVLA